MLTEKHRPRDWSQVIAQTKATRLLEGRDSAGTLAGCAYWIAGPTGFGKTTLARIIATKVSDSMHTEEIDAGDCGKVKVAEIKERGWYAPMTGVPSHCIIINEAHGLRKDAVRAFLVLLEQLPRHVTVIFTTTLDGQMLFEDCQIDSTPLLDRCIRVQLAQRGICKPAAEYVKHIAELEGLDGQPLAKYERLLKEKGNSIRAALMAVETGVMLDVMPSGPKGGTRN